jgi:hypothetical protein
MDDTCIKRIEIYRQWENNCNTRVSTTIRMEEDKIRKILKMTEYKLVSSIRKKPQARTARYYRTPFHSSLKE